MELTVGYMERGIIRDHTVLSEQDKSTVMHALSQSEASPELIEAFGQFNGGREMPPQVLKHLAAYVGKLATEGDLAAEEFMAQYNNLNS